MAQQNTMGVSTAGRSLEIEKKSAGSSGRLYNQVTTIKAAWHQVAEALWNRYPNPQSKHVLSDDTVSRRMEDSKLFSKRLIRKTNRAPRWMEMFVGGAGSAAGVVEESIVDISQRTFTTYTRNINFAKLMLVEEKCVYYESPENKQWTCCGKQVWVKCGVRGISRAVEKFGIDRYRKNAKKAELGLEYVLGKLFSLPALLVNAAAPPMATEGCDTKSSQN